MPRRWGPWLSPFSPSSWQRGSSGADCGSAPRSTSRPTRSYEERAVRTVGRGRARAALGAVLIAVPLLLSACANGGSTTSGGSATTTPGKSEPPPTATSAPPPTAQSANRRMFAFYYLWWDAAHWHARLGPAFPTLPIRCRFRPLSAETDA